MHVLPLLPPLAPSIFHVDAQYNGSLAAALVAVGKAKLPAAEVILGPKEYAITEHMVVPAGTSIKGVGAAATTLSFTLHPPGRGQPNAAFEMVRTNRSVRPPENNTVWLLNVDGWYSWWSCCVLAGLEHLARGFWRGHYRGNHP